MSRGCITLLLLTAWSVSATEPAAPAGLQGVRIDQRLGARVPGDLTFTDETGRTVRLSDYFGRRPIVLTPASYKCPILCTMTLNAPTPSMNGLTESVGEQFGVLTFSFDPRARPEAAAGKKRKCVCSSGRASGEAGWNFLTGD